MAIKTNITKMLGIKHPIVAAPMGPFYTTKLTVAVSEAGGLGVLSHVNLQGKVSLEEMKKAMLYVVEHTDKNFGFNIRTARLQPDAIKLCRQIPKFIMENPKIKEQCVYLLTSAGSPKMINNRHFEALKNSSSSIKHFHVAPSLELAEKLNKSGVDGIVATGNEGGGHQSYENISTLVLLQQIRTKLPNVPLIASGGYATGVGLASALAMGAGAIAMGSRFISSKECEFHQNYKDLVTNSRSSDTKLITGVFGPARVLKNKFSETQGLIMDKDRKKAGETSMSTLAEGVEQLEKVYAGNVEEGTILLGQSAGLIEREETVYSIINSTVANAKECLKNAYKMIQEYPLKPTMIPQF